MRIKLFVLCAIGLAFNAYDLWAIDDSLLNTSIEEIARKYRPTNFSDKIAPKLDPGKYKALQQVVTEWHRRTERDRMGRFIMDNFYPELRGVNIIASGQMIASANDLVIDLKGASKFLKEVWVYRNQVVQGGTRDAGQAVAKLMKRFAQRPDIHKVNKDTGTTPYNDLRGDISRLPDDYAYRINWGFKRLADFDNPREVQWTPSIQFQLGKDNQNYIKGFMEIQFAKEKKPKKGKSKKQASLNTLTY